MATMQSFDGIEIGRVPVHAGNYGGQWQHPQLQEQSFLHANAVQERQKSYLLKMVGIRVAFVAVVAGIVYLGHHQVRGTAKLVDAETKLHETEKKLHDAEQKLHDEENKRGAPQREVEIFDKAQCKPCIQQGYCFVHVINPTEKCLGATFLPHGRCIPDASKALCQKSKKLLDEARVDSPDPEKHKEFIKHIRDALGLGKDLYKTEAMQQKNVPILVETAIGKMDEKFANRPEWHAFKANVIDKLATQEGQFQKNALLDQTKVAIPEAAKTLDLMKGWDSKTPPADLVDAFDKEYLKLLDDAKDHPDTCLWGVAMSSEDCDAI